jgi:peptidoglycan/xylan/chitin deacetylase (PgdA/CDA1 family)
MDQLSNALREIIGRVPTYMRAPYFSTNDLVLRTMGELNFHVVHASIDTLDWQNQSEGAIEISVQRFREGLNQGGTIALAHDVHPWTASRLAQAMVDEVKSRGLRGMIMLLAVVARFICPRFLVHLQPSRLSSCFSSLTDRL